MRSDAFFGDAMHFFRANLDFKLMATRRHHGGAQRLIEIGSRHGNEILDTTGDGAPDAMNQAEDGVAILHGLGDDADRQEIVYLVDGDALTLQLLIDGVRPLDAPVNTGGDVMFDEALV